MTQRVGRVALLAASVSFWPALADAIPITYNDVLAPGVPVTGEISSRSTYDSPRGAEYYLFYASSGDAVEVTGARLVPGYDMAFWIFEGLFADTEEFGRRFDDGDPGYVGFYDDEIPYEGGPWGDPLAQFVAPSTGGYTIAVTNYLSSEFSTRRSTSSHHSRCSHGHDGCGCSSSYPFQLVATGPTDVPEPASLLLLALGLTAVRLVRLRRRG